MRAAILAVQLPDVDDAAFAASLAELHRLGQTLGVEVVATVTQKRDTLEPGTVVGSGKLGELKGVIGVKADGDGGRGDEDEDEDGDEDGERTGAVRRSWSITTSRRRRRATSRRRPASRCWIAPR